MTQLRHLNIKGFKDKYNLSNFYETGCWHGDGIQEALNAGFSEIRSCDVGINYVRECKERFKNNSNVYIHHENSLVFLWAFQSEKLPSLFWLDAHFPVDYGTDITEEKYRLPLLTELEFLRDEWDISKSVIICDDIRNLRSVMNPRYRENELHERFILDVDWEYFVHILDKTHNVSINEHYDGIAYFTPKE